MIARLKLFETVNLAGVAALGVLVGSFGHVSGALAACVGTNPLDCTGSFAPPSGTTAIELKRQGDNGTTGFAVGIETVEILGVDVPVGIKFATPGTPGKPGDPVTVNLNNIGTIVTSNAPSVVVSSTGGRGGNGGPGAGGGVLSIITTVLGLPVPVAGDGGPGGDGGNVSVNSLGTPGAITTTGDLAAGIYAVSQGGNGGDGGDGFVAGKGGKGGRGGNAGVVTVDNIQAISTSGNKSNGILARSLGGNGGNAGDFVGLIGGGGLGGGTGEGRAVFVTNNSVIATQGFQSSGIVAQSVGGFSGAGGDAVGLFAQGGQANFGGPAGEVKVTTNGGSITTNGGLSFGIFAQSVGGGGGAGGNAGGLGARGGDGAPGGNAGVVTVTNHAVLDRKSTRLNSSHL